MAGKKLVMTSREFFTGDAEYVAPPPVRKLPRGRCPYCGRTKAVTKAGKVHKHRSGGRACGGSGQRPS